MSMRSTIFALLATSVLVASCSGGGGGGLFSLALSAAYDLLEEEQGDSFVSQYPDPFAYSDLGWELYREAGFGTLSWSGGMSGHELERTVSSGGTVSFEDINNLSGRVRVTISGVEGQNTRVSFSEVVEQVSGTQHNLSDLMFSLLPHLEAGSRHFVLGSGRDAPPSARIEIKETDFLTPEFRQRHGHGNVSGSFWRLLGVSDSSGKIYRGSFEAEREGSQ